MEHERRKEAAEVRAALPVVTGTRTVLEKFRGEVTEDSVPYEVVVIEDGVKVYQGPPLEEEKKKGGAADGRP